MNSNATDLDARPRHDGDHASLKSDVVGEAPASGETVSQNSAPVTVIQRSPPFSLSQLMELWRYRHLALIFAARDVKVRYKQTVLGFAWVFVQPLALTVVYSIIFGRLAKLPSDGVPYPVFVLSGIALWQFFAIATGVASASLTTQAPLIGKVYFPRIIVVLSPVLAALLDFVILLGFVLVAQAALGVYPGPTVLFVPFFVLLAAAMTLAVSLWLSALDAYYRDVRYALAFALQVGYFATPIVYPLSVVPHAYAVYFALNPLAAIMEGFRWSLLGGATPPVDPTRLAAAIAVIGALLVSGYMFFRRAEGTIVDRL